ncbi:shikimate dehydrogenase [Dongia soli]|uniref:Shikimate dehydrogenase (NADP(+)) n=1 Tax=Dongia soli TaxID=600628 RepID=A0ABU5E755_9PROT|nr:shikimate dehydrogenase [Dongia soli]MDY0881984.1 shikimate dehydrogenase [Dongia soli]
MSLTLPQPPRETLTGKSLIAGVFGWPVTHSRSPRLHGYWLKHYGIDGAYIPFSTHPAQFETALRALPALGFRGANVTLPHKEKALACIDQATERARRIGAVNTVMVQEDGTLLGDNTDGFGFLEHLQASAANWRAGDGPAVVLGAGGASRAIVVALLDAGVPEIRLVNRTTRRAEEIAEALNTAADRRITVHDWDHRAAILDGGALLVNTTQLGLAGQPALEIDLAQLPVSAVVDDIVYVPMETSLLAAARKRGNAVVDGLGMLLHQARPGFAAWFKVEPDVTPALRDFVLADIPGAK